MNCIWQNVYNAYVGWFWVEKAVSGIYSEVSRQQSDQQYSYSGTRNYWSHKEMGLMNNINSG